MINENAINTIVATTDIIGENERNFLKAYLNFRKNNPDQSLYTCVEVEPGEYMDINTYQLLDKAIFDLIDEILNPDA